MLPGNGLLTVAEPAGCAGAATGALPAGAATRAAFTFLDSFFLNSTMKEVPFTTTSATFGSISLTVVSYFSPPIVKLNPFFMFLTM